MFTHGFYGVFNRHGECEAVADGEDAANDAADNISRDPKGNPRRATRAVAPVLIFRGSEDDLARLILGEAAIDRLVARIKARMDAATEAEQRKRGEDFIKTKREKEAKDLTEL